MESKSFLYSTQGSTHTTQHLLVGFVGLMVGMVVEVKVEVVVVWMVLGGGGGGGGGGGLWDRPASPTSGVI